MKLSPFRLGLCCIFREQPIRFYSHQATAMARLDRAQQLEKISTSILANIRSLYQALRYCAEHHIGSFRINSKFFPLKTHPKIGYDLEQLPQAETLMHEIAQVKTFASNNDLRLTFHPDQFTLLSSPKPEVIHNSVAELIYHGEAADLLGADVIMIHGGGAYGNKPEALARTAHQITQLPDMVRQKIALENDDRIYTPADLLPLCKDLQVPFVYDVHHHRCLPDGMSVEEATNQALETWSREPLFHLSSPRDGWQAKDPKPHHDCIQIDDFPGCWLNLPLTVELEAKAKELAVAQFKQDLRQLMDT